ncbi:MAG: hypothetical protein ACRD0B_03115 [Acidimicrobiales bacterium]
MSATTIKVDTSVRDRLARVARARGTTMAAMLEDESRRLEVGQRWRAIEIAYDRLRREDPAAWHEYLGELERPSSGEPDTSAVKEWPEHNR